MTVTDTGIGVRKEDWKRIFKRNVQTTEAQRLGNGRGLGLAIASDLAAAFGGNISLESTSGVGSRFTLSLPLGERPALDKEITITRKRAVKWEGQDQKSPKDMH